MCIRDRQKVFDFSQPAFQTTFDSKAPAWEVSIKGSVKIPVTEHKTEKSVVSGSSESIKARATQKSAAGNPPASVSITDGIPSNQTSDNGSAVLPSPSLNEPTSEGKTDVSISHNSAEGSVSVSYTHLPRLVPRIINSDALFYDVLLNYQVLASDN